jgi:hypothetical protein
MNIIRGVISTFLLVLIIVASAGMRWAGSHLPPAQAVAGRLVLMLCILAGVIGLVALWRPRPTRQMER